MLSRDASGKGPLPERFTHPGLTPSALSSCETVSPYAIIRKPYVFLLTPLNRVTLRPVNQKRQKVDKFNFTVSYIDIRQADNLGYN